MHNVTSRVLHLAIALQLVAGCVGDRGQQHPVEIRVVKTLASMVEVELLNHSNRTIKVVFPNYESTAAVARIELANSRSIPIGDFGRPFAKSHDWDDSGFIPAVSVEPNAAYRFTVNLSDFVFEGVDGRFDKARVIYDLGLAGLTAEGWFFEGCLRSQFFELSPEMRLSIARTATKKSK